MGRILCCLYACSDALRTVKVWTKRRKLNNPYHGTLSSYGYVLLVIHYLINVRKPAVLPNLQRLQPPSSQPIEKAEFEGRDIYFFDDLGVLLQNWQCTNRDSVGELLIGFFHHYQKEFRYNFDVVSIRTEGGILSKMSKGWHTDVGTICNQWTTGSLTRRTILSANDGRRSSKYPAQPE